MKHDSERAKTLFEECMNDGDLVYAPCNLGHMLLQSKPERAEDLYRTSLENEVDNSATEALIGLSILLAESNSSESQKFISMARERTNFNDSIDFMAEYYDEVDLELSEKIRSFV